MNCNLQASGGTGKQVAKYLATSLLFLLPYLLPAQSLAAQAKVDHIHGVADFRSPQSLDWQRLHTGDSLSEGSVIRTSDNSDVELLTSRGHRFVVRSVTQLELTSLREDDTQGHLESGRVLSKVKHLKKNEKFAIQTPTVVCAVRGTEFEASANSQGSVVAVFKGIVGLTAAGSVNEMALHAGQMTSVHNGTIEMPRPIPRLSHAAATESALAHAARHEVGLDMSRNQVIAAAAMERRLADYQEGKTLMDVSGKRVRLEEYIVRPAANQFKFVVLDERGQSQLDYFFYKGTLNKNLPTDLSVAIKDLSGKLGTTAPDYYLTAYEMGQSNTQDSIHDTATGGHLVKVTQDGSGNYILSDPTDPTNTRTVAAAQLQSDGTYKIYNPLADSFSVVSAAQKTAATQFGVYLPENDTFRDLAPSDTLWKTRFNSYEHDINNIAKITYLKGGSLSNVLASTLDANYTYAGGFVIPVVQTDPNNVDATITNYYGDGTFESYRTVLINDQGGIAPLSAFSGISSGAQYKGELLKWNYEQQASATEFQGRKIDLVVEPKIFLKSGLIN